MDTDELSTESYNAIIIEAEQFHHDLTLQFGLLSNSCVNENEYLLKTKVLISKIQRCDEDDLFDIFFESQPDRRELHLTLEKILDNISEVEKIPENKRHYDF
jgi:hypothetical protein